VLARTPSQPRAPKLQLAKECPEDDSLVTFDAEWPATAWARGSAGQERCYLQAYHLPLQFQQERLRFNKTQTDVFLSLMLLVEHANIFDALVLSSAITTSCSLKRNGMRAP
jgi:hypothetical protein